MSAPTRARVPLDSIDAVIRALAAAGYVADRALATSIFLAVRLEKPLLLEGESGVGKTEVAKVLAEILDAELIRLQCYEGLDANAALYEWNYPKQLLAMRLEIGDVGDGQQPARDLSAVRHIFTREFLIERPLLKAIDNHDRRTVLLIDEVDRCDQEFEAFLLEVLSDFQITVPELGTIRAKQRPVVVLTSNRTREINDALKRRCLYHWIPYPSFEKELEILKTKVPGLPDTLARQICAFMEQARTKDFFKKPGVAESLDWAAALLALERQRLDEATIADTLGVIFKYREDVERFDDPSMRVLFEAARRAAAAPEPA
ncbi:MAG TPA: MoxR family ATPase [Thermodesulfobacteriota bacterium]|nr:MoxR family ATPase [Thermodesulfobacteriota bacterium]